jgi:nitroreductase
MARPVLDRMLRAATAPVPADYAPEGAFLVEPYLVVNAVEGLAPGTYRYREGGLLLLQEGRFRRQAGFVCLEQPLAADAAVTVFLMAPLEAVLDRLGDRGYRAAQLEGGVAGGRLYLGAYAHGYGATGVTFYDDEVTALFSPHAEGRACLLAMALGESPRLTREGIRPATR